ncbi:cytochrome P450 [Haloarcula pellucida]|uniref:Putative cytochrome P450 YjiB n=1 Tax=Haloarcula pellucida TaxID=1427151 RepID=A0A830GPQ0_9EURY|nr:cytochrome P450 [Halomicroarcula pellucida]MBX0349942.1 cytochrome P450 [Halomicroarcula pellucida]GGN95103.1 putative cytochrome P450 YjiB [Halomicroarcula pellucida]
MATANQREYIPMPKPLQTDRAWLDPSDWYREQRAENPVRFDPERQVWDVFTYDETKEILEDHETFTSDLTQATAFDFPAPEEGSPIRNSVLRMDPPKHTALRGVADDEFLPGVIQKLTPQIAAHTDELLDAVADDGEMDVIEDLAYPLPVTVIAQLLGIPPSDSDQFKQWSDLLLADAGSADDPEAVLKAQRDALTDMRAYFLDLIEERRADPSKDLVSVIATAQPDGEYLADEDAVGYCMILLIAGNITTTNLIGNSLRTFKEKGLIEQLRNDDELLDAAIEEVLRYRSPSQALTRVATRKAEVNGHTIEPGEFVITWLGSANRDEAQFEDPETFNLDRSPNNHLAFGHGIHFCQGASLARLEAKVALKKLLGRFESIQLTHDQLEPVDSAFLYGTTSLPIAFEQRT